LLRRLEELLADRGVRSFGDLGTGRGVDRLQVIVSDVTARRLIVLPRDAGLLGVHPADFSVALALRMSAGIPIIYEPVQFPGDKRGGRHLLVDGGMLSNFPIWSLDEDDPS